jgi:hypothetical protein
LIISLDLSADEEELNHDGEKTEGTNHESTAPPPSPNPQ